MLFLRDESYNLLNAHALVIALFSTMVFKYSTGSILHGRKACSSQLVGIDNHIDSTLFKFCFSHSIERGWHNHYWRGIILLTEFLYKLKNKSTAFCSYTQEPKVVKISDKIFTIKKEYVITNYRGNLKGE